MLVDEFGRLNISLFHGTSSLFVNSISKMGLGGKNPNEELKTLDLLIELKNIADPS